MINLKGFLRAGSIAKVLLLILFTTTVICQAEEIGEGFYVSEINAGESRILTPKEIEEITADYEDKLITMSELEDLLVIINNLYNSKGYIARAILPAQKIENGIVNIQLVEACIGEIILEGNEDTGDNYFLKRISFKPGDLIKLDNLENELFYFNATNDVRLQSELKAGHEYGTTDLILKVEEPEKDRGNIFCDNAGRSETGLFRYGINLTNYSLTSNRDILNLTYFLAEGTNAGALSYSFPLNRNGTRLVLNYNNNITDIVSGEFETVNIKGDYREYGIGLNYPWRVEKGLKVDNIVEYHNKMSDTYFSGVNLLNTDVKTFAFGESTQSIEGENARLNSHIFLYGLSSSANNNYEDPGTSNEFFKYNWFFENQRILKDRNIFTFRSYLQIADNKLLPSSEQFSIGGMSTVRGFEEGKLIGDQGYYLNAELGRTDSDKCNPFIFFDHGGIYPYKGNEESFNRDDYLTSVGLGLNINFTSDITGKFVLGLPLNLDEDPRVHLSIQNIW